MSCFRSVSARPVLSFAPVTGWILGGLVALSVLLVAGWTLLDSPAVSCRVASYGVHAPSAAALQLAQLDARVSTLVQSLDDTQAVNTAISQFSDYAGHNSRSLYSGLTIDLRQTTETSNLFRLMLTFDSDLRASASDARACQSNGRQAAFNLTGVTGSSDAPSSAGHATATATDPNAPQRIPGPALSRVVQLSATQVADAISGNASAAVADPNVSQSTSGTAASSVVQPPATQVPARTGELWWTTSVRADPSVMSNRMDTATTTVSARVNQTC